MAKPWNCFFSALLGILIAFQLEAYQNNKQENAKLRITLGAIKEEIENNQLIYKNNTETLSNWFDYYSYADEYHKNGRVKIQSEIYNRMNKQFPLRFNTWKKDSASNNNMYVFNYAEFIIDVAPTIGVSTSSWQTGLYSGVLNQLDAKQLTQLNKIYQWIERDMGLNDKEFYEMIVLNDNTNLTLLYDYYQRIIKIQQFKMERIDKIYAQIEWP